MASPSSSVSLSSTEAVEAVTGGGATVDEDRALRARAGRRGTGEGEGGWVVGTLEEEEEGFDAFLRRLVGGGAERSFCS